MQTKFNLIEHDNHLIFNHQGQNILIDTGNPISVSHKRTWNFLGKDYKLLPTGTLLYSICQDLGFDIDMVLGLDIMRHYNVLIDYSAQEVTFSDEPLTIENCMTTQLKPSNMGLTSLDISIDGQKHKFVLDTGAKISYVSPNLSDKMATLGQAEDFYPNFGRFVAPTFEATMTAAGMPFNAVVGNLPERLQNAFGQEDIYNIIGSYLFKSFKIALNLRENEISLKKYA